MSPLETQFAIGDEKVSISIVRKTKGDLLVATYACERFFRNHEDAKTAIGAMLDALTTPPVDGEGKTP